MGRCHKKHCCNNVHSIYELPYHISEPGVYRLCQDLEWGVAGEYAITIDGAANNVTLLGNRHRITLTHVDASGVLVSGVENTVLKQLDIQQLERSFSSSAVAVVGSKHVRWEDGNVQRTGFGLYAESSVDIKVKRVYMLNNGLSNVATVFVSDLELDQLSVENDKDDLGIAGVFTFDHKQLTISNSRFKNSDLFLRSVEQALITDNEIVFDDPDYIFSSLQIGTTTGSGFSANAVTIRDNVFSTMSFEPVSILGIQGQGVLIERNTLTMGLYPETPVLFGAAITLGGDTGSFQDVQVRNNIIGGQTIVGISVGFSQSKEEGLKNITITGNHVTGTTNDGLWIVRDCRNLLVQDNHIGDCGNVDVEGVFSEIGKNGVHVINGIAPAFIGNTVSGSGANGFYFESTQTTPGLLKNNNIFQNVCAGINDATGDNVQVDNTVFGNGAACASPDLIPLAASVSVTTAGSFHMRGDDEAIRLIPSLAQ